MAVRYNLERPKIFLKISLRGGFVNPCNKKVLGRHRANMDMKFVLDAYPCAALIMTT